jgi:hypothetical protein
MNLREKVSASLTQVKGHIRNWFDRFFPEYASVFKDWEGKASLMTAPSRCPLTSPPREPEAS